MLLESSSSEICFEESTPNLRLLIPYAPNKSKKNTASFTGSLAAVREFSPKKSQLGLRLIEAACETTVFS